MSLAHSQKNYINKNIKKYPLSKISQDLNINDDAILDYLRKKWGGEKLKNFLKNNNYAETTTVVQSHSQFKSLWPVFLFLFLLILGVFGYGLGNEFVSDDIADILNNPELKDISYTLARPTGFVRPLINFFMSNIFGSNPAAFRLVNLLFHVGTVFLTYLIVARMVNKKAAFIAATLFAVHPLLVEPVVWISGGNYVQYSFFLLLTLFFYIQKKGIDKFYFLALLSFFLGLQSHLIAISFPAVLLVYDLAKGNLRKNWVGLIPFFGLSLLWVISTLVYIPQRAKTLETTHRVQLGMDNPFLTIPVSLSTYLELFIFPKVLTLYHSDLSISTPEFIVRTIILVLGFLLLPYAFIKNKLIFFWMSFFVITLSPTLSPFRFNWIVAERYAYLPTLGLIACVAILLEKLSNKKSLSFYVFAFFAFVIIIFSIRSAVRVAEWKNQDTLWVSAREYSKLSPNNHNNLGDLYGRKGDLEGAIREFQTAILLKPDYADAHHNLGNAYRQAGKTDEALISYQEAMKYNPNIWQTYQNMAAIYFEKGQYDLALQHAQMALKLLPNNPNLYVDMALIYGAAGDLQNARAAVNQALTFDPNNQRAKLILPELEKLKK